MRATRSDYSRRSGDWFAGDMAVWLRQNAEDNSSDISRLKRSLRLARKEALTERQAQVLSLYYDEGMTMCRIGELLGVNKATVCRTLKRAKARLEQSLKYTLPYPDNF